MSDNLMSSAVRKAYERGEEDETINPICRRKGDDAPGAMKNGDYIIFYDLRGEREVEISESLLDPDFKHFEIKKDNKLNMATLIEYSPNLPVKVAFPPEGEIQNSLCQVIAEAGLKQLKVAETEKEIHVKYFLNGKKETVYPGEERIFIPSNKEVKEFDALPEMNAADVADAVIQNAGSYDFTFVNFANCDVVGHVEKPEAVLKAVQTVDDQVKRIIEHFKDTEDLTIVITADHGSSEDYLYEDGTINTGHTANLVPFIIIQPGRKAEGDNILRDGGSLVNVAPTVLDLMGLSKPDEMTGVSLISQRECFKDKSRVLLLLLDGWGYREEEYGNMIKRSGAPTVHSLIAAYPFTTLHASGLWVGLPEGTVGNSEAGHMHIGAGRVVKSDKVRINDALESGEFFENEAFCWAMDNAVKDGTALHLLGIVSFFSSHGEFKHLEALIEMAAKRGVKKMYLHAMLGRRGERKDSGAYYIEKAEEKCSAEGVGTVATVMGRYWPLDREFNWDRIEKAYRALVFGDGAAAEEK